ncbi:MAG: hypothetical protein V1875_00970 [Candidatus Altiarchaeota archaeon]
MSFPYRSGKIGCISLVFSVFSFLLISYLLYDPYGWLVGLILTGGVWWRTLMVVPIASFLMGAYTLFVTDTPKKVSLASFILSASSGYLGRSAYVPLVFFFIALIVLSKKVLFERPGQSPIYWATISYLSIFLVAVLSVPMDYLWRQARYMNPSEVVSEFLLRIIFTIAPLAYLMSAFTILRSLSELVRQRKAQTVLALVLCTVALLVMTGFAVSYLFSPYGPPPGVPGYCVSYGNVSCFHDNLISRGGDVYLSIKNDMGYDISLTGEADAAGSCKGIKLESLNDGGFPADLQYVKGYGGWGILRFKCGSLNDDYFKSNITLSYMNKSDGSRSKAVLSLVGRASDEKPNTKPAIDQYYSDVADYTGISTLCTSIDDLKKQGSCVKKHAKTGDECKNAIDVPSKEDCLLNVAKKIGNVSLCYGIYRPNMMDKCFLNVGTARNDVSACRRISDQSMLSSCLGTVAAAREDVGTCVGDYPEWMSQACILGVAQITKNATLCAQIKDALRKDGCLSQSFVAEGDFRRCQELQAPQNRQYCTLEIAKKTQNISLCGLMSDQAAKDDCLYKVNEAVPAKDGTAAESCGDIQDARLRDKCYLREWVRTKDPGICGKIYSGGEKWECVQAQKPGDLGIGLCMQIPEIYVPLTEPYCGNCQQDKGWVQARCIIQVAKNAKDIGICGLIRVGSDWAEIKNDECVTEVAKSTRDLTLCKKVTEGWSRNNCQTDVLIEIRRRGS